MVVDEADDLLVNQYDNSVDQARSMEDCSSQAFERAREVQQILSQVRHDVQALFMTATWDDAWTLSL